METKKYTSYAEIERDLEILKLEKEIFYQKIKLNFDKTKESFIPSKSVSFAGNLYQKFFSGTYGSVLKVLIPYGINWLLNKKRGY